MEEIKEKPSQNEIDDNLKKLKDYQNQNQRNHPEFHFSHKNVQPQEQIEAWKVIKTEFQKIVDEIDNKV